MVWGTKNYTALQGGEDSYGLPSTYAHVSPQSKYKEYKRPVSVAVVRNCGEGACAIQQAEVDKAVAADDIQEAQRRAMQLSNINLRYEKANQAHERNPEKQSLEAGGIFKKRLLCKTNISIIKAMTLS